MLKNLTYQCLPLQQRCFSIKHKHRLDAKEEKLTYAVEESEEVSILDTVAAPVPHSLHGLVQPYANVWGVPVKVKATTKHSGLFSHSKAKRIAHSVKGKNLELVNYIFLLAEKNMEKACRANNTVVH